MSSIKVSKFNIKPKALDLEGNNTIHSKSALKRNQFKFLANFIYGKTKVPDPPVSFQLNHSPFTGLF